MIRILFVDVGKFFQETNDEGNRKAQAHIAKNTGFAFLRFDELNFWDIGLFKDSASGQLWKAAVEQFGRGIELVAVSQEEYLAQLTEHARIKNLPLPTVL